VLFVAAVWLGVAAFVGGAVGLGLVLAGVAAWLLLR
jgi:hypothetical protein